MEAGRELDARIAELLGWTFIRKKKAPPYGTPDYRGYPPGPLSKRLLPEWSTSWAAMQQVVEAMRARGYWLACEVTDSFAGARFAGVTDSGFLHAPTLPHAVCEAALAAIANVNTDAAIPRPEV